MKRIRLIAGMCAPIRDRVALTLAPYGVVYAVEGATWLDTNGLPTDDLRLARADSCAVTVRDQAAAWAEYLLLRSGRFRLLSTPLDPRNERWAVQWRGTMPRPWVESGCDVQALSGAPGVDRVAAGDCAPRGGWLAALLGGGRRENCRETRRRHRRGRQ